MKNQSALRTKMAAKYLVMLTSMLHISACGNNETAHGNNVAKQQKSDSQMSKAKHDANKMEDLKMIVEADKILTLTGEVRYQSFEGGFYGFIANNGDKYMPSGLKPEHRKNGLILQIKAQAITDRATTQQFGTMIKVLETKVIDASKVKKANDTW